MDDSVTIIDIFFISFLTLEFWMLDKLHNDEERRKRNDTEFDYYIQRRDDRKFYWSRRPVRGRGEDGQGDNFPSATPSAFRLPLE